MNYTRKILKEQALIIEHISGEVTLQEMVIKTQEMFDLPDYDPTYNGVIDLRDAQAQMSKVELYGFANFLNQSEFFGHAKWAIIADDPLVVALAMIFQQRILDSNQIGIFNTVGAAANFIGKLEIHDYVEDYGCV